MLSSKFSYIYTVCFSFLHIFTYIFYVVTYLRSFFFITFHVRFSLSLFPPLIFNISLSFFMMSSLFYYHLSLFILYFLIFFLSPSFYSFFTLSLFNRILSINLSSHLLLSFSLHFFYASFVSSLSSLFRFCLSLISRYLHRFAITKV